MQDWELIRKYADEGAEWAFAEFVKRYVNLVYSAALRAVQNDSSLAEEATQKTFCLLAKKASGISRNTMLVGWLYKAASHIGREVARGERRRRFYEEKAAMNVENIEEPEAWKEIAPCLEEAMGALAERDRLTLLLRFFQSKSMREVGETFQISEDAAKMRVARALERLRKQLAKKGVVAPASLGVLLLAESVSAAPGTFAAGLANSVLAAGGTGISLFTSFLFMSAVKKCAVAALILASLLIGVGIVRQTHGAGSREVATRKNARVVSPQLTSATAKKRTETESEKGARIDAASANLRAALIAPVVGRKAPIEGVEKALSDFGSDRSPALAILMEALNRPRGKRPQESFHLAAYGISLLGPEAARAWPDLLKLLRAGEFMILNDYLTRLLTSVSPDGAILPDLIATLQEPSFNTAWNVAFSINRLIEANPGFADIYRPQAAKMLESDNAEIRGRGAWLLARWPGEKDPRALEVLVADLNIEKMRDPHAYDPVPIDKDGSTRSREGERMDDELARWNAVLALRDFGEAGKGALPALREIIERTPATDFLRDSALIAVNGIAPGASPEAEKRGREYNRGSELAQRANDKTASFDELMEGLQYYESVQAAAGALKALGERARPALPALLSAIDSFADFEAVQRVKELAPEKLVERLAPGKSLYEVADAIGDLGPKMSNALPRLEKIFEELKPADRGVEAVAEAIQKIRPGTPQLIFHFYDLHDASAALLKAIYDGEKINGPVDRAYHQQLDDLNLVTRPQLIRFVDEIKTHPELQKIFVDALVRKNPSLAREFGR